MAVTQREYEDRHRSSGRSTSSILGDVDADTKAVIRAINDNLNEHIADTAKRFDGLEAKVDGLADDVSGLKDDVKAIHERFDGIDAKLDRLLADK